MLLLPGAELTSVITPAAAAVAANSLLLLLLLLLCSKCTPTIAVDDPRIMLKMPKSLTAATGMDALTHAVEAYVSTISNPVTGQPTL
jgi:alcohol dehydrogenase